MLSNVRGVRSRRSNLRVGFAVAMAVMGSGARGAWGNPTFVFASNGTVPTAMLDAANVAGARWTANFTDNVTFRISLSYGPQADGSIENTSTSSTIYSYSEVRAALLSHATSADDLSATANLRGTESTFPVYLNFTGSNPAGAGSATPYLDNNGNNNNKYVTVNNATARALGLTSATGLSTDGSIAINSLYAYDLNPRNGITAGQYDFVGAMTHEIGHILGFASGVDVLDANPNLSDNSFFYAVKTLDLFRFSTASVSAGNGAGLGGVIDWTADSRTKYFSVDGGQTALATFANGKIHGDGFDAGHWKDGQWLGVMGPTLATGQQMMVSEADRRAFDAIGFTRNNSWSFLSSAGGSFNDASSWDAYGVPGVGQDAVFGLGAAYTGAVTLSADATVRDLVVRGDSVTLSAGGAKLKVSRSLQVGNGVAGNLTLASGTLQTANASVGSGGVGVMNVSGGNWTNAGTVTVGAGSVVSLSGGSSVLGTVTGTGSVVVSGTGVATARVLRVSSVSVGGVLKVLPDGTTGATSVVGSLSITGGGFLDVGNNSLVITGTTESAIRDLVRAWYGNGARMLTGLGTTAGGEYVSLAVVANEDLLGGAGWAAFAGVETAVGDVLVKYTYLGDTNLDGLVNVEDLDALMLGLADSSLKGWRNGDLDYDGVVGLKDLTLLWGAMEHQGGPLNAVEVGGEGVVVPEPGGLGWAAVGVAMLGRRRRRLGWVS